MAEYKKIAAHFHEVFICPLIERCMELVVLDACQRGIGVFTTTLMEDGRVSVRRIPIEDCVKGDKDGL